MSRYADLGSHWLRQAAFSRDTFGGYGGPPCHTGASYEDCRPGFAVGFTLPKAINDKMRAMDLSARSLDTDFSLHVDPNAPAKKSWREWFALWSDFFRKTFDHQLFNFIGTDEQAATVNSFDRDLQNFHEIYRTQLTASGEAVPPPSGPGAPSPLPSPGDPSVPSTSVFSLIPWWGWTLAVGFIGALGYSFYRAAQHAKEREEYLFKNVVPALVPHVPSSGDAPL
jgi:hypothetical protein